MTDSETPAGLLRRAVGAEAVDDRSARSHTFGRGVDPGGLFGGQMIAQALSASAHTVPEGAVPDSLHVNMFGGGRSGTDIDFKIDRIRDGRSMQHRDVRGYQDGRMILQATVVSTVPGDGPDWQLSPMPVVGEPDTGSDSGKAWASALGWGVFEIVHPKAPEGDEDPRPSHPLWIRATAEVSDDPWMQAAVLAYWSDFGHNWAVRVVHNQVAGPVNSISASHTVWFHRPPTVHRWHLFDVHTQSLAGNQGFVRATLSDQGGGLVATVDQRVFLRHPAP